MPSVTATDAAAADTAHELAVLLQAGITPERAWRHLADTGSAPARRVCDAVAGGVPLVDAIANAAPLPAARPGALEAARRQRAAWSDIAAAWRIATTVGAPLAVSLRGIAVAQRDAISASDDIRVALAEPAATARLMSWLPLVAVALGAALGFDTVGVIARHPLGVACVVAGGVLMLVSHRWTRRLVRRAQGDAVPPSLDGELLAIALSGGVSIDRAMAALRAAPGTPEPDDDSAAVLTLSRTAGVPAVELLRAASAHARHRARVAGKLSAARLSTRLLLPLGVCTLPAFLLLGVGPMLLSVVSVIPLSP